MPDKVELNIDFSPFVKACEALITSVTQGSRRAMTQAAQEILRDSLEQVPRDTNTLASSAFYSVDVGNAVQVGNVRYVNYTATVGYGKGDPINPKTGKPVSEYMVTVHEDLEAKHPIGKAKFLEDPVRAYQDKFAEKAAESIRDYSGL